MEHLLALLNSTSKDEAKLHENDAIGELRNIFPESTWGLKIETTAYTNDNRGSLWNHELNKGAKNALEKHGVDKELYATWLGDVHFHTVTAYLKSVFEDDDYRDNTGWRVSIVSVPRAKASLAGIASHYQNAQNHIRLGEASALIRSGAEEQLARSDADQQTLPGRAVNPKDWDSTGLMLSPVFEVAGKNIRDDLPDGLNIKCARNTTTKKTISSFITLVPHFADLAGSESILQLQRLRDISVVLARQVYPFTSLKEFEAFRSLALNDLNAASVRFRMKSGSSIKSIVKVYVGPPGTGKTLTAVREAVSLVEPSFNGSFEEAFVRFNESHHFCCLVTFHPSLQYHDLVESIRPIVQTDSELEDITNEQGADNDEEGDDIPPSSEKLAYAVYEGPLLRMIRRAQAEPSKNFVVVIDEINRGDLSRILGPLISCLEADKRAGAQYPIGYELQYPKDDERDGRLYLPSNLHILGTMNSTDRNVALVDFALRRRFEFVHVPPNPELLKLTTDTDPIDCGQLLEVLNKRVTYLLDDHHQLGHGFLMGCETNSDVCERLAKKIIPQLREYFFGNEGMLPLILGEAGDSPYPIFKYGNSDDSFKTTFGVSRDVASSLGFRGTTSATQLKLDPRFWSDQNTPPGPGDSDYAASAIRKIYSESNSASTELLNS